MTASSYMAYILKKLVNDTIGAPLEHYEEEELLLLSNMGFHIPLTLITYYNRLLHFPILAMHRQRMYEKNIYCLTFSTSNIR